MDDGNTRSGISDVTDRPWIHDTLPAEMMAACIAGTDLVQVTIRVQGSFDRPGTHVEVPAVMIVTTVPGVMTPGDERNDDRPESGVVQADPDEGSEEV